MKQDIKDMIYALRDKGNNVTAEEIADLTDMFEDVSEKDCDAMLDDVMGALAAVISLEALKRFDGKTMTPEALAVLMQSPNIRSTPVADTYTITDADEHTMYKICVAQVELIDDDSCCYISIAKYEEDNNEETD